MINVIICGAAGRMGKANISVFNQSSDVNIVAALEIEGSKFIGQDAGSVAGVDPIGISITSDIEEVIADSVVTVDFTNCITTLSNLKVIEKYGKAVVIGTTGFTQKQIATIKEYSKNIPVLLSPNMSLGVNILAYLVKRAAELLGEDYDTEIVEMHHNRKKDAPSGTAIQFGKIIAEARGKLLDNIAVYERRGIIGERKKDEIGIMSLRLADVAGEHTIIFGAAGERIEFSHRCLSRKTYATGALRAVRFIAHKKSGFYTMADVLGLQ